ncbi:hypothetical protein [Salinispora arenicola]|uniref:hypothetical protein n=1 Tax=Salinispora arenicola TaxID=168697 RepID=UPI0003806ABF|nr:hypothetical protein [Salinispora arenicola]MCN0181136.1 hypothetical protein [Salinispora arenicola]
MVDTELLVEVTGPAATVVIHNPMRSPTCLRVQRLPIDDNPGRNGRHCTHDRSG